VLLVRGLVGKRPPPAAPVAKAGRPRGARRSEFTVPGRATVHTVHEGTRLARRAEKHEPFHAELIGMPNVWYADSTATRCYRERHAGAVRQPLRDSYKLGGNA